MGISTNDKNIFYFEITVLFLLGFNTAFAISLITLIIIQGGIKSIEIDIISIVGMISVVVFVVIMCLVYYLSEYKIVRRE